MKRIDLVSPPRAVRIGLNDVAVAAIALGLNVSTAAFTATKHGEPSFTPAAFVTLVIGAFGLIVRRRLPVASLVVVGLTAAGYGVVDWPDPLLPFGVLVAVAAVFEYSRPAVKWVTWTVFAVVSVVGTALVEDSDALDWWTVAATAIGAPLVGDYVRSRRRLLAEVTSRLHAVEAERLRALDDARAAERARVARELHDVVAHHVTLLVVQAEAAASRPWAPASDPRTTFDDLARSGRSAMNELRSLLGVLRQPDIPPSIVPQPTLAVLDDLVSDVESAGVTVVLQRHGDLTAIPLAADLAGFRVLQEGLTNVVKHAPGATAEVNIECDDHLLTIDIANGTSRGAVTPSSGCGVGLVGLYERVGLVAGTLSAGPLPLGGFRLHATIPVDGPA